MSSVVLVFSSELAGVIFTSLLSHPDILYQCLVDAALKLWPDIFSFLCSVFCTPHSSIFMEGNVVIPILLQLLRWMFSLICNWFERSNENVVQDCDVKKSMESSCANGTMNACVEPFHKPLTSQAIKIQDIKLILQRLTTHSIGYWCKEASYEATGHISKVMPKLLEESSQIFPGLAPSSFEEDELEMINFADDRHVDMPINLATVESKDDLLSSKRGKLPSEHDCASLLSKHLAEMSDVPVDGSTTQGEKTASKQQPQDQKQPDSGSPVGQLCKNVQSGTSSSRPGSGNGSGGDDDGGDNRRPRKLGGGCNGDTESSRNGKKVKKEEQEKTGLQKDDSSCSSGQTETSSHPRVDESAADTTVESIVSASTMLGLETKVERSSNEEPANVSVSTPVGVSRNVDQKLRLDVAGARSLARSECINPSESMHCPTEENLVRAFDCRHKFRSEAAWEKCGDACCRELQYVLAHTGACHLRVLGGCEVCIQYKNKLCSHALHCKLPIGKCVVLNCDAIREHFKQHGTSHKWMYQLDRLFFSASPPPSPCLLDASSVFSVSCGDASEQGFTVQEAKTVQNAEPDEETLSPYQGQEDNSHLDSEGDVETSGLSNLSPKVCAEWDQHHKDRPPDGCGDGNSNWAENYVQPSESSVRTSRHSTRNKEQGEVLWQLNREKLSPAEVGSYLEGVHWHCLQYIGGGSCGRCYMGRDIETGFLFAIKKIPQCKFDIREVEIWGTLTGRHPNILELYGAIRFHDYVIIFMEYMEGGSLEDVLDKYGKFNEFQSVLIMEKVISAVDFMHSLGIVHCDIKGGNVLLDATGHQVKLADLGTSIRLCDYQHDRSPRGTEAFMAPEVCRCEPQAISFSAEIWSLMCLLYQMLEGQPPWMEFKNASLLYKIGTASDPPVSPPCSPDMEDFFSQGFRMQPEARATARALLRHRVFQTANLSCGPVMHLVCGREVDQGLDNDSSLGTSSSGATESLVSQTSMDPMVLAGQCSSTGCGNEVVTPASTSEGGGNSIVDVDLVDGAAGIAAPDVSNEGLGLPAQLLQSLQSNLYMSRPDEDLEEFINQVADNVRLEADFPSTEDAEISSILDQICGTDTAAYLHPLPSCTPQWSYSMTDLTKIDILDREGNFVLMIRARPGISYGTLAKDMHSSIGSVLNLEAFSLARADDSPIDVRSLIGSQEQAVKVFPAHDHDNWQQYRWRVDVHGLVQQLFEV